MEVDAAHAASLLSRSLMAVTALAPPIGYDGAVMIDNYAHATGLPLREAASAVGDVSPAEFDARVEPGVCSRPGQNSGASTGWARIRPPNSAPS